MRTSALERASINSERPAGPPADRRFEGRFEVVDLWDFGGRDCDDLVEALVGLATGERAVAHFGVPESESGDRAPLLVLAFGESRPTSEQFDTFLSRWLRWSGRGEEPVR